MKKLRVFLSAIMIVLTLGVLTGCGEGNVDYDLVASGNTITYSTVENMKESPRNFVNKTFKIRGKLKSNGGSYHYLFGYDSTNCCEWTLEVRTVDDVEYPETTKNVVATGIYKSAKTNGRTSYYLEISEFE